MSKPYKRDKVLKEQVIQSPTPITCIKAHHHKTNTEVRGARQESRTTYPCCPQEKFDSIC